MQTIIANGTLVYVDFVLYVTQKQAHIPLVYSVFDRSEIMVRGFLANTSKCMPRFSTGSREMSFSSMGDASANYISRLSRGMEKFCHGIAISEDVGEIYIVTKRTEMEADVYSYLMNHFQLPLLREWIPYLLKAGQEFMQIKETKVSGDDEGRFHNTCVIYSTITQEDLIRLVSDGLRQKKIRIGKHTQKKLEIQDLDDYFAKYGHTIVNNLRQKLQPLTELKERVEEAALLHKRLYPQQAAITNGMIELMDTSNYGIMNCGCGTGKTVMGCVTVEGWFYRKYLRTHKDKTLKDAYSDPQAVKYRNIVMCPSHLVEKWKREIENEIPYVQVTIIHGLKELGKLQRKGRERTGKEFYILSKDTGKLSYSLYPQPWRVMRRKVHAYTCAECRKVLPYLPVGACDCGCADWQDTGVEYLESGLVCPECGQLLYPMTKKLDFCEEDARRTRPLQPADYTNPTDANKECRWCHAKLWAPSCEPLRPVFGIKKHSEPKWLRISHYANKAKRNVKTVWVLKKYLQHYLFENGLKESEIKYCSIHGPRRFAPASYIKKKLKGYFDFAIFDEVHDLKGGGTAQGIAMHALVKASRKQLGLTGTIAGGYANHIFYLLFRLDPAMMVSKGFRYGYAGEMKFSEVYGTVETVFECSTSEGAHNTTSRGRMISSPKCRPGISPLIFSEFLMKKAVFLDLSDMSRYLPDYREEVKFIPMEEELTGEYRRVTRNLKEYMARGTGRVILSSYLQFALSYTDKPYDRRPIVSPLNGCVVEEPGDFSALIADGKLLKKEEYLVELVNRELGENRNLFIFCEYTGEAESNVTHRLKAVIENNCVLARGKTLILESQSPQASAREAWIQEKAEKTRVFITNPKCVETGIDLIFYVRGIKYNYPTLIFYQLGYNLFTIWQASRRAFRLIQTEECRTYYLASLGTVQTEVIKMIGEKQVATAAIQGAGFSSEGLSAMASGVDPRIRLANTMAEDCSDTEESIQSMFDVLKRDAEEAEEDSSYTPMLTFYELTGYTPQSMEDYGDIITIPFPGRNKLLQEDLLTLVFGATFGEEEELPGQPDDAGIIDLQEGEYTEQTVASSEDAKDAASLEDSLLGVLDFSLPAEKEKTRKTNTKNNKKTADNGQLNILDLFTA